MAARKLDVPKEFSRSGRVEDAWARASALWQLGFIREQLGLADLSSTSVLDMGCGVKLTAAFLEEETPIGRYTGVDVYGDMIEFLSEQVDDPRFSYHHVDFRNELYNPDGEPMTAASRLPVDEGAFDVIWLFSVFTHLGPEDFGTMLRVLRRHVRDDGRLLFSLYIDEPTAGGHGFRDAVDRKVEATGGPPAAAVDGFQDVVPEHPLRVAMYSRDMALELVEGTGWDVLAVNDPGPYIQHSILCAPVEASPTVWR